MFVVCTLNVQCICTFSSHIGKHRRLDTLTNCAALSVLAMALKSAKKSSSSMKVMKVVTVVDLKGVQDVILIVTLNVHCVYNKFNLMLK